MKNITVLTLIITILLSCTKNNVNEEEINNPFLGEWNLNSVTGGFAMPEMYGNGEITFNFKEDNNVEIKYNISIPASSRLPFTNDTLVIYKYDSETIEIGNFEYYYIIEGDKLSLDDDIASDGALIEFNKCNTDNPCNPPIINNPFLGEWNLNSVTGGFAMPEMYGNGEITFNFKEDNNVEIKYNISIPASSRLPFTNDTLVIYKYDSETIEIGNFEYYYIIEGDKLSLDNDVASDGMLIELNR